MVKLAAGAILASIPFMVMLAVVFVDGVNLYGWRVMVAGFVGGLAVLSCIGGGIYLIMVGVDEAEQEAEE